LAVLELGLSRQQQLPSANGVQAALPEGGHGRIVLVSNAGGELA
jgi:hypothetical protein